MWKFLKDESGESAVVVALSMTAILAMAALVLDIGMAYVEASSAQNAADAIALSVGRYLPVSQNDETKLNQIINEANKYAVKNGLTNFKAEDLVFEKVSNGKYRSLSVKVEKISETRLVKVIGVDDIKITKSASVSAVPTGSVSGAAPIGLTEEVYDAAIASGQTDHLTLKVGGGEGVNGFFGLIVLDGSNGNANVLEKWLKYGYE
ncbi:MAG: pilus assembly protein, partial [Eubacteriales bacterium]|nr:pilus assembly protein [Eubacteriales bacterium]